MYTFEHKQVTATLSYYVLHYTQVMVILAFDVIPKLDALFGSTVGATNARRLSALFVLAVEALSHFPVFAYSWYISREKMRQVLNCRFASLTRLAVIIYAPYYLFGFYLLQCLCVADTRVPIVLFGTGHVLFWFLNFDVSMQRFPLNLRPSPDDGARYDEASMEDGALRQSIECLAVKEGLHLSDIKITNYGVPVLLDCVHLVQWFRGATVYITSPLLEGSSVSEITAVVAQAIGYSRKAPRLVFLLVYAEFALIWAILLLSQFVSGGLGPKGKPISPVLLVIVARYAMRSVSAALRMATNAMRTKQVYESDAFAAELGYGPDLQSVLMRMHETMPQIERDWLYDVHYYPAPTFSQRIRRLNSLVCAPGTSYKGD